MNEVQTRRQENTTCEMKIKTALQQHLLQTFSCIGPVKYGQGPQSTSPWSLTGSRSGVPGVFRASVLDSPEGGARLYAGCKIDRHSPRQLRVAADVAFSRRRSWSRHDRGPLMGKDSMDWTRFFCWPSAWFITWGDTEREVSSRSSITNVCVVTLLWLLIRIG